MYKILVKVKPFSKKESVEKTKDGSYIIKVNAIPSDGEANTRVIELLAKSLGIAKSQIQLIKGHTSKIKTFLVVV